MVGPTAASKHLALRSTLPHARLPIMVRCGSGGQQGCSALAVGDVDGDGRADVVVANGQSDSVSVLLGSSSSYLSSSPLVLDVSGRSPLDVKLHDTDMDGHLDIVTANAGSDTVSILLGCVAGQGRQAGRGGR